LEPRARGPHHDAFAIDAFRDEDQVARPRQVCRALNGAKRSGGTGPGVGVASLRRHVQHAECGLRESIGTSLHRYGKHPRPHHTIRVRRRHAKLVGSGRLQPEEAADHVRGVDAHQVVAATKRGFRRRAPLERRGGIEVGVAADLQHDAGSVHGPVG